MSASAKNRREDIAGFARNLLTWMVAGQADLMSDARVSSCVTTAFKLADEWRSYKDELDRQAEEVARDDVEGSRGVI